MIVDEVVDMVQNKIKEEKANYNSYMKSNPKDLRRRHDHAVIISVYIDMLYALRDLK